MAYDAGFASGEVYRARELATGYVTLATRDIARASRFYELIAREMGVGRSAESSISWVGASRGVPRALASPCPTQRRNWSAEWCRCRWMSLSRCSVCTRSR